MENPSLHADHLSGRKPDGYCGIEGFQLGVNAGPRQAERACCEAYLMKRETPEQERDADDVSRSTDFR